MGDQSLIIGGLGSSYREFRFGARCPGGLRDAPAALGDQCCFQHFDVVCKVFTTRIHVAIESWPWLPSLESPAAPVNSQPTTCSLSGAHSRAAAAFVAVGMWASACVVH